MKTVKWFQHDKAGMFIHWRVRHPGAWRVGAQPEHTEGAYQQYLDEFNPVDYDGAAGEKAGMKYAVSQHHDGFCLFDKLTDYTPTLPAGRDLIREYIELSGVEGLKGLYYSIIDWQHPDYPHYGDRHHPMRDNEAYKGREHNFDRYLDYMHGQIKELCTNYGKIDIFWFDFAYDHLRGEAWRATELMRMIRSYQPDVITDNRLEASGEGFGSLLTANPTEYSGDFVSPEQIIPPEGIWTKRQPLLPGKPASR